jgi:drug/metabolite transporter (DMT)-like permease
MCQVVWTLGLIYASLNTIQSQAYVFNNIHGLFLVLIGVYLGAKVTVPEKLGVLLIVSGCIFMVGDPKAARINDQ